MMTSHIRRTVRLSLNPVILLLIFAASQANASCPTGALPQFVSCNNPNAIRHIVTQHCSNQRGESEFSSHYCDSHNNYSNLVSACQHATTSPNAQYQNNCYKEGEEGEIVGNLPNGNRTNCYQVNFVHAQGHNMTLNTMYPAEERYCTQH
jgi:hypothetical protein